MNNLKQATISIGGISFHLSSDDRDTVFDMEPSYEQFVSLGDTTDGDATDVSLRVSHEHPPDTDGSDKIFDTETNWKLLLKDGKLLMPIISPALDPEVYKMLEIDEHFRKGSIYLTPGVRQKRPHSKGESGEDSIRNYPFQYPLDEVLTVNLLSRGRGVEIHGLGVDIGGEGVLFTGTSGAGKSTLAELWKQHEGNTILSDDRLIVRPDPRSDGDGFLLYGTPWHGDAGVSAPGGVPLRRILVLNQAGENRLEPLSTAAAATLLLVRCFPTFWDRRGMDFTIDIIGRICASVPCYELRFRPEQAAIDTAVAGL